MGQDQTDSYRVAQALDRIVRSLSANLKAKMQQGEGPPFGHLGGVVLLAISDIQPCSIGALTARVGRDHSQMTRTIRGLETLGLVQRDADPSDGRVTIISLTASGQAQVASLRLVMSDAVETLVSQLPRKDRKHLVRLVEELVFATESSGAPSGD